MLFVIVGLIYRPAARNHYSFANRVKIALNPLPSGLRLIRKEDLPTMRWFRLGWQLFIWLLALRLTISVAVFLLSFSFFRLYP